MKGRHPVKLSPVAFLHFFDLAFKAMRELLLILFVSLPALAQEVIYNPGYCAQFYRTQIAKTWDLAIRTPMAATIETTGTTATRQSSIIGNVTIRRTAAKVTAFGPRT